MIPGLPINIKFYNIAKMLKYGHKDLIVYMLSNSITNKNKINKQLNNLNDPIYQHKFIREIFYSTS